MRRAAGLSTLGVLALVSACSRPQAESRTKPGAPMVAVARVARGDVSQTLTVAAEFKPYQEVDLHAKVAGYVKTIAVDVGDHVQPGQLIAVLEVPELQDELQQDAAAVERAREDINRSAADLERAESTHEVAHLGSTRLAGVSKARPSLIAQQDLDEAASRDHVAEAQVSTAKASVAEARGQLEIAKAMEAKTRTLLAYTRITAPFAGVITHRYADTGAMIQAGTSSQTQAMPLVRLSETRRLRLVIPVPESVVPRIRTGQSIDVRVPSTGRTFPATVSRSTNRLEADSRTMLIEVDIANPALDLVPGMYAQASIALADAKHALTIPVQAIDRANGKTSVLVVTSSNTIEPREVGLQLESADTAAVTGLNDGELVVLANRARLEAGMAVVPKLADTSAGER
jgi:RND family efflux transporter MFP subunit